MKKIFSFLATLFSLIAGAQSYTAVRDIPLNTTYDFLENQPNYPSVSELRDGYLVQPVVLYGSGNVIFVRQLNKDHIPAIRFYFNPAHQAIADTFFVWMNIGDAMASPTKIKIHKTNGRTVTAGTYTVPGASGWVPVVVHDTNRVALDWFEIEAGIGYMPPVPCGCPLDYGGNVWGSEVRVAGRIVQNVERPAFAFPKQPVAGTKGTNGFYWDLILDNSIGYNAFTEVLSKTERLTEMGHKYFRMYTRASYMMEGKDTVSFQPTVNEWYQDTALSILKRRGINAILTTMGSPWWIARTWPDADSTTYTFAGHGFPVGQAVRAYWTGSGMEWQRCNATPAADNPSWLDGVVIRVIDANTFVLGETSHTFNTGNPLGLLPNTQYYLSASTTAGTPNYTATMPAAPNILVPLFTTDATGKATITRSTNPGVNNVFSPVLWEDRDNRENPAAWVNIARLFWLQTARYGRNAAIPDSLMGTIYQNPHSWIPTDVIRKGLNLLWFIEPFNEIDLNFWSGWLRFYSYHDGRKYAAAMSAIKDAHKGTLTYKPSWGPGVGVGMKFADSTMKLVFPGLSSPSPAALMGYRDWCIENRGWIDSAAGIWDDPVDIYNFHDYSKDADEQYTDVTVGYPPELSGVLHHMTDFVNTSKYWLMGKPIWLTEYGWDHNNYSRFRPMSIKGQHPNHIIGYWDVASRYEYSRLGIQGMTYFKLFADDTTKWVHFASMQQLKTSNTNDHYKFPIGDFSQQTKHHDNFVHDSTFRADTVRAFRLHAPATDSFVVYVRGVEKPYDTMQTFFVQGEDSAGLTRRWTKAATERTGVVNIPIPSGTIVRERHLVVGGTTMTTTLRTVTGNMLPVTYGLAPVFLEYEAEGEAPPLPPQPYYFRLKRAAGYRLKTF